MNLHIFTDDCDYIIAETLEQAMRIQRDIIGENPLDDPEDWSQCADDTEIPIWLDLSKDGDVSEHYDGTLVLGTFSDWAENYGSGLLCSTEY